MTNIKNDIKDLTDNGLADAAGLISRREYNLSIVRSRQTAESIIKAYAAEKDVEYTGLADTIEKLFEEGIINRTSRDAFHSIRIYGNKAVHEGDKDPEDAQKAFYLLKNEVRTFLSHKTVSVDRTPVKVELGNRAPRKVSEEEPRPRRSSREEDEPEVSRPERKRRENRDRDEVSERRPKKSGKSAGRNGNGGKKGAKKGGRRDGRSGRGSAQAASGFSIYDLLRVIIPVIVIFLLIIIIRSLIPSKKAVETTTEPVIETTVEETQAVVETVPETEPETEPPVVEYKIKTDGVNIRYADNQNRIYAQLSKGTAIGTVEEVEGSDYVSFTLDGVKVVVRNDMIEPIEN